MNTANPLHTIMNPKSIGIVGAGNNPMKMGTMQALSIIKDGYQGKFFPVHPRDEYVLGHKAYRSVSHLPQAPELAVFVVPTDQVVPLLEDFGLKGTRYAVIITAGFRETGEEGRILEEKLKRTADKYGIRFLGPNCIGILNTQASLNATVMQYERSPGPLGMASQSGTYITQTFNYLRRKGILFSKGISVGNETNIDIVDALEYLGEDEATKAIALYIEGIRDGRRFIDVARRITPHKPVIAQYVGGSEAGARAGASHTGSMAGPDYLYDGIFKQAGVIRVDTVEELYAHGWALATQPRLKGDRIGVLTNSGGPGTAMANTCNRAGLKVPEFSSELQEKIKPIIPKHASSNNPVDITFHMDALTLSAVIPDLVMQSKEVDGVVLHGAMGTGFLWEIFPHLKDFLGDLPVEDFVDRYKIDISSAAQNVKKYDIPFLVSSFLGRDDDFNELYRDNQIPVYDGPEKAASAMVALKKYMEVQNRGEELIPSMPKRSAAAEKIIRDALKNKQKALDEYSTKRIFSAYGINVAPEGLVFSGEEALEAARSIGFPVALKGCSPDILHKSEKGIVFLNLRNEDDVLRAFDNIRNIVPNIPVLVSKMIKGTRELMAGMVRFEGFGPAVMFGLGGIFTEAIGDSSFRVAPLTGIDTEEMIKDIRASKILEEFRGMPAVDRTQLGNTLQAIGYIALLHPDIAEIDVNPIIVEDSVPVAVDALITLQE